MSSKTKTSEPPWKKRSVSLMKKKSKKSATSISDSRLEEASEIFFPKNRREIFTHFFNTLTYDLILSREVVMKTIDYGESSETSISDYRDSKEGLKEDNYRQERLSVVSVPSVRRKEMLFQSEMLSTRSSIASAYSIRYSLKHKERQSIDATSMSAQTSGSVRIVFAPEVYWLERIVFKNGNVYEGQCSDYLMDEKGTFTWTDKTVYHGEFTDGYITGKGEMILPTLSKYKGDFCRGIFHGSGIFNPTGLSLYYYGSWKNGKKHGKGLLIYDADDWYEGDWYNDLRHGIGYRRYKNGAKYKGEWVNNKKQGKGKMMFENNDYYNGEWFDDKPHGYGEYTWDMLPNEIFSFPLYSWYKGSWKNGERDGVGILHFGTECGAKYAGMFFQNIKHGPGVMICGNGLILESNPLFQYNKPVHKNFQKTYIDWCEENPDKDFMNCTVEKGSYYDILKMVDSKIAYNQLNESTLVNIIKNSEDIPAQMYVKLADSISGSKKIWCPLDIPIHSEPENVDFSYFIDKIFEYGFRNARANDFLTRMAEATEEGIKFRRSIMSIKFSPSMIPANTRYSTATITRPRSHSFYQTTHEATDIDASIEERLEKAKIHEFELCKNVILINRPKLNSIYYKYASLAQEKYDDKETNNENLIMVRLFLWQLFRDGHVQDGVELAQVDSFLWKNPYSCLGTEHYPFEPIYFYQFLLYLMGCSWLIYLKKLQNKQIEKLVFPSQMLRLFLDDFFAKLGSFTGSALRENLNIAPITKMYKLYASISEPMSVNTFFAATYRDAKDRLPCYAAISSGIIPPLLDGKNIVPMGHEIYYVKVPEPISERMKPEPAITNADQFSRSLLTFRTLGKAKITECLTTVCPKVAINDKKLDMNYNLTFLEFYEIVIMLSFAKAEEMVIGYEEHKYNEEMLTPTLSCVVSPSKMKDKLAKKKKIKKSAIGIVASSAVTGRHKAVKST